MRACRALRSAVVMLIAVTTGCLGGLDVPDDGADTDSDATAATVLAEIDPNHFCDMVGLVDFTLVATAVGCADGSGCALDEPPLDEAFEGTVVTCPAVDTSALLGVELRFAAEYRIAAVAQFTTGEPLRECFSTATGAERFVVGQAQIDASAQIHTADGHEPCPQN